MGLWIENRDDKTGVLVFRARFVGGAVDLPDGERLSVVQAVQLAKLSAHLPAEKRDWVLRVDAD